MARPSIIVTGSHGVGKTTLVNTLSERLKPQLDVAIVPETARQLVEQGFYVNDKISIEGIFKYVEIYLQNRQRARGDLVISDRAIFDLYAYTKGLFSTRFDSAVEDYLRRHIFSEVDNTTFFVYVPIEFDLEMDGLRPDDLAYQREVDETIRLLFDEFQIEPLEVSGSISERIRIIENKLRPILSNRIQLKNNVIELASGKGTAALKLLLHREEERFSDREVLCTSK